MNITHSVAYMSVRSFKKEVYSDTTINDNIFGKAGLLLHFHYKCKSCTTTIESELLMATSLFRVSLLLLVGSISTADICEAVQNTSCISKYPVFEEAAITNNSDNTYALFSTLYPPNQPLPYSIAILYQVHLTNGTMKTLSSDPKCPSELWLWTYSPVFMLFEPNLLNKMTYYALNNFQSWKSPTVMLTVPKPCPNVTFKFLNEMTMAVSWPHIPQLDV